MEAPKGMSVCMLSLSILSSLLLHALVTHLNQLKAFFLELKVMEAATSITVQLNRASDLGFGFISSSSWPRSGLQIHRESRGRSLPGSRC
jgi:hypothetical protein